MTAYKIAAAALPVALAWGALGWSAWRAETRRQNRVDAVKDAGRRPALSERPDVMHAMNWRPEQ